ncbi:cell division protein FtsQ/DivIB [Clostridium grantii]|uniref:Cell division protein FtsQ n=1 Tax=Clostridium grantii DSM 8605 TaxID=1121316 RepID=A0A1M5SHC2_9CLOT|nr:FtsQ-type POTRA domain-containing protein [Clostridium grantii]SHH37992.1 cell division protein FtsQ [Clostridium grantii DSM 8605]
MSKKKKNKLNKILFFIFLISIVALLLANLPIFSVKKIQVINNKSLKSEKILELSQVKLGTNIFFIKSKNIEQKILSEPEIEEVKINRKLPNTLVLDIKERKYVFYIFSNGSYYLLDNEGFVFDKKETLEDNNLIELKGLEYEKLKEGESIEILDSRKMILISSLTDLMRALNSNVSYPTTIDITDLYDIKVYFNSMEVRIGNIENLKDKFNIGINILNEKDLADKKGYIEVNYGGNPVFYIEN